MTDDRKSGIALIAGSLGGVFTMAIHPTGAASLTADQVAHLAVASAAAHSLAMVSFVVLFLGGCGLARSIGAPDRIAFSAIVTYGFACVAGFIATAVSGFIVPSIMRHMILDVPATAQQWRIVIDGIFKINQAFARIYSVAASLAIILWSVSALRNGGFGRGVATYGCVIAPLIIVGIVIGRARLNVHAMAMVVSGQAIWSVMVGAQLYSRRPSEPAASI